MPLESPQERFQRPRDDRTDGQAAAVCVRTQRTHGDRWELQCDGYRRLGRLDGPLEPTPHTGTPTSEKEALDWSYPLARKASRVIEMTYHFGEAFRTTAGEWIATWYSLEFSAFGRSAAVRIRFPQDGGPAEVKSTFYRPRLRAL